MHYSRHWALDDLQEEHGESMRLGQMADPLSLWDKPEEEVQEKESFGEQLHIMCLQNSIYLSV